ncbi:MAG: VOC family protein [Sphaerobacteraceae bacterium]|nr:MAG: VOC family protein [Sphaerobacteraceae bacterium]
MQIPTTGVHHITLIGSNKEDVVNFYEGVLGMPFIFEQPNLDVPEESHLYFDPGDGCLITYFVRTDRETDPTQVPEVTGATHHIAYSVSKETYDRAAKGLEELGYPNTGEIDRGFMDSLYFHDPNGHRIELACYKVDAPEGYTMVDVLIKAHELRVAQGDHAIEGKHMHEAVEALQSAGVK